MSCPFQVLGLSQGATLNEVTKQYRKLALKFHPDKNTGNSSAASMTAINNARDKAVNFINKRASFKKDRPSDDLTAQFSHPWAQNSQSNTQSKTDPFGADYFSYSSWYPGKTRNQRSQFQKQNPAWEDGKTRQAREQQQAKNRAENELRDKLKREWAENAQKDQKKKRDNFESKADNKPYQPPVDDADITEEDIRRHEEYLDRLYAKNAEREEQQRTKAAEQARKKQAQQQRLARDLWSYSERQQRENEEQLAAAQVFFAEYIQRLEDEEKAFEEVRNSIAREEQMRIDAEAARLAEIARLAAEERLAEEIRLAEEVRLTEELRLVEEARLVEQARLAEQTRLAEELRLVEEARVAEQLAAQEKRRQDAIQESQARRDIKIEARKAQLTSALAQAARERQRRQSHQQQEIEVTQFSASNRKSSDKATKTSSSKHRINIEDDDAFMHSTKRLNRGSKDQTAARARLSNEHEAYHATQRLAAVWNSSAMPAEFWPSAHYSSAPQPYDYYATNMYSSNDTSYQFQQHYPNLQNA